MVSQELYSVFDPFLERSTWHTSHEIDRAQFMNALAKIVDEPNFSPEKMRDYMRVQKNPKFHEAIDKLTQDAWAITDFLKLTGR